MKMTKATQAEPAARYADNKEYVALLAAKYGRLSDDWRADIAGGFAECFRVLRPTGVLIFKWAEVQIPTREVLRLTPHKPLFGHRSGKRSGTHWMTFLKDPS